MMNKTKTQSLTIYDIFLYILDIKVKNLLSGFILFIATFLVYSKLIQNIEFSLETLLICKETKEEVLSRKTVHPLKFWVYGKDPYGGHLKHVYIVLNRLGYKNVSNTSDWDLLWAHDYPFKKNYMQLSNLKPHQKVNHFPGCGYITNKVDLSTSDLKYVPKSFKLPDQKQELIGYKKDNPDKIFIQKNNDHRGIKILKIDDVDLKSEGSFIQEYIDKPFLVDGFKFDIGVYTVITSIEPLRIYIYMGDALFRYCPEKYYPLDINNLNKYVVGDDYLPTWQVPSLKYYYNDLGFSMKDSFNAYARSKNKNPSKMWENIEDAIRTVILSKEESLVKTMTRYKSNRNFFELMRIDFVADEDLNIYLLEANMSPNLSSAHYPPNQLLYEQVIYNVMSVVGVAVHIHKYPNKRNIAEELMMSADKNIMVFPNECNSDMCKSNCMAPLCQLCQPCLTSAMKSYLIQAYREHVNRMECKRIFPPPMKKEDLNLSINLEGYSSENQLQYRWFIGKCMLDSSWC